MLKWGLFFVLALIWGSSFILIKKGLDGLNAFNVASLRIVAAAVVLLPVFLKNKKQIKQKEYLPLFLTGVFGNLVPAYLFALAEQNISSAIAGVLNSLTPIFAFVISWMFFAGKLKRNVAIGIILAFSGAVVLSLAKNEEATAPTQSWLSVLYIIIATMFYGLNVNYVKQHLSHLPSATTASAALALNAVPALLMLALSGFFRLEFSSKVVQLSIFYTAVLGICSTAIATVLFYVLIKKAGVVFSSMVTYAIPVVALGWGLYDGEHFGLQHLLGFIIIICGVVLARK